MANPKTYTRSAVVSGLVVVGALFIFGLFAFKVGRFDLMGLVRPPSIEFRTAFLDVKSLRVGAEVKVGGRRVGEVRALNLVDRLWPSSGDERELHRLVNEVIFDLYDPSLRIDPATAGVSISQDSPLAPHFLVLDPGRWLPERVPPTIFETDFGAPLELPAQEPLGFDDLLALARPAMQELLAILETLNYRVLTPENMETVGAIVDDFGETAAGSRKMVDTLNRDLFSAENLATIDSILVNLDLALADGRRVAGRLDRLLDAEQDPRLDNILTDIAAVAARLDSDLTEIEADVSRVLESTDRTVNNTGAELSEALRRLQRAMWQGEMALRKIRSNPAVLLFGDDETDLEARDVDLTRIRLQGRAEPYEQRDERDDDQR